MLARLALVRALRAAGDLQGALEAAREANALNPNVAAGGPRAGRNVAGGGPPADRDRRIPARAAARSAIPHEARFQLGCAWAEAGEAEKALEQFALISPVRFPNSPSRSRPPRRCAASRAPIAGYVRHLFDQFSADYDARMRGQLAYRAPEILRELADLVMPGAHDLVALDLGCGTGLAGEVFADIAPTIDGIDLSPAMIEKARARRRLPQSRRRRHRNRSLRAAAREYDLVLAADTLVYLGDLTATFSAASRGG